VMGNYTTIFTITAYSMPWDPRNWGLSSYRLKYLEVGSVVSLIEWVCGCPYFCFPSALGSGYALYLRKKACVSISLSFWGNCNVIRYSVCSLDTKKIVESLNNPFIQGSCRQLFFFFPFMPQTIVCFIYCLRSHEVFSLSIAIYLIFFDIN
jgi:hypothetical protein